MKKLLALFLVLCMLLSACQFPPVSQDPTGDPSLSGQDTTEPETTVPETTEPEPTVPEYTMPESTDPANADMIHYRLNYKLTQDDVDEFYRLLDEGERVSIAGEDIELADELTTQASDQLEYIADQMQIAYVLYCIDQTDEALSEQYLSATDIVSELQTDYMESIRRIYLSNSPANEVLFKDWTEKDFQLLLAYDEEATRLEKRNAEIVVEYRALDPETMEADMIPLYNELVRNYNRIAQIYDYNNYYEYAYDLVYERDYLPADLAPMRASLKTYLAPIVGDLMNDFNTGYQKLPSNKREFMVNMLYESYTTFPRNLVDLYIKDLPEEMREPMGLMFKGDNAYFAKSSKAYAGAFTTEFEGEPFCYFGPGYSSMSTLVHELGHYYAAQGLTLNDIPMDLAETHSQSNEWLFMTFLEGEVDAKIMEALKQYKLYEAVTMILVCAMVDEFEEKVYTHPNAGNLTAQEYDDLMKEVAEGYGGLDYINSNMADIQYYWKVVAMESPVYYISYAVSSVASLNVYTLSQKDEAAAREALRFLAADADTDQGFLWNIKEAGLTGPFDEQVYKDLNEMLTK